MFFDLRYAGRQLRKSPGLSLVVVLTLALGIGATTAIFTLVQAVLLRPLAYPGFERIVAVWTPDRQSAGHTAVAANVSGPDYLDWSAQSRSFSAMALYRGGEAGVVVGTVAENAEAAGVSEAFFQVMGVGPAIGRGFSAEEVRAGDAAVVGPGFVGRHFAGDGARALGATVLVRGRSVRIVGVMPAAFDFPAGTEIWTPIDTAPLAATARSAHNHRAIARLAPGVSLAAAQAEMEGIAARLARAHPASNTGKRADLMPLHRLLIDRYQSTLWVLFGAVGLVLLLACANVANLLLARGLRRQPEILVRTALGAGRARIARQLLCESLLLALLGGALGVLAASWSLDALLALAPAGIPRLQEVAIDRGALLFAVGVSLLVCLLTGLFPVAQAARADLDGALRRSGRGLVAGGGRLRAGLVVAQLALSLVLLTGAGLLLRSYQRLSRVDPGFSPENLLVMTGRYTGADASERAVGRFEEIVRRAAALPGVSAASFAGALPIDEVGSWGTYDIEGRARLPPGSGHRRRAAWRVVGPDTFATLGVPVRAGRAPDRRDTADAPAVVAVNETMARASWPDRSPLGQRIRIGWDRDDVWMTIVGVVADTRQGSLATPVGQELYVPSAQHSGLAGVQKVLVRTARDPEVLAEDLRRTTQALDPGIALRFTTAQRLVERSLSGPRFRTLLIGSFAALALLLALVGVAGVVACVVAERQPEIGLRLAIGAPPAAILRQILLRALRLALVGVALGLAASLAATRALEHLLFEVSATDPGVLALVSLLLLAAAVGAAAWPARRAARLSPMTALRMP